MSRGTIEIQTAAAQTSAAAAAAAAAAVCLPKNNSEFRSTDDFVKPTREPVCHPVERTNEPTSERASERAASDDMPVKTEDDVDCDGRGAAFRGGEVRIC